MGLFSRKTIIDERQIAQLFDLWAWLLECFDGYEDFLETELIQPSDEHFPIADLDDEALPSDVFDRVRQFAGLQSWDCELVAQERRPGSYLHGEFIQEGWADDDPDGTFHLTEGDHPKAVISYSPDLVDQPENLVATLAHELAHYLLSTAAVAPPGGADGLEPATDVATVFMGFGIFGANAAFQFSQYSDTGGSGWQWQSSGYLSQQEWAYALAIFLRLQDLSADTALDWLSDSPRGYVKKAMADLKRREAELERLRQIKGDVCSGPQALVARELDRLDLKRGRLVDHTPGTVVGNLVTARRLLDRETTDLHTNLATLRRKKRPPKDPLSALLHWCGLAAAAVLLREERPEEAELGLRAFDVLEASTDPEDLPAEAIEVALALSALTGDDSRTEELRIWRLNLPMEDGFAVVSHALLHLATPQTTADSEALIWSAVRGWRADLELTGGETGPMLVCLLAARLDQTGLALADQLRGRLAHLERHSMTSRQRRSRRPVGWHPLGLQLHDIPGCDPAVALHAMVASDGRIDGAITSAAPITSHLHNTISSLEEALTDSARHARDSDSELEPAQVVEILKRLRSPKQQLHLVLHPSPEAELPPSDLQILEHRFRIAVDHLGQQRDKFPRPGDATLSTTS